MISKPFKASRLSMGSAADEPDSHHRPPMPPTVTFGRRTSSGCYSSYSRDDLDSELGSTDFMNYTVQMPLTPDTQLMDLITQKVEEQYVSSSLFMGGQATATMCVVMKEVDPRNAKEYHAQLTDILKSSKEKVDECYKLIVESSDDCSNKQCASNKRKYPSMPSSPNGVIYGYFSCESSTDSWEVASSVSSLLKSLDQHMNFPLNLASTGVLSSAT